MAQYVCNDSIAVGQRVEFRFNPALPQSDTTLFSVEVNPTQTYVELGTDDNTGYTLVVRP